MLLIPDLQSTSAHGSPNHALEIAHFVAGSVEHQAVEAALLETSTGVPMGYRAAAIHALGQTGSFIAVREFGRWIGGVFIEQRSVRALPGFCLWRIDDFGDAIPGHAQEPVLRSVRDLVRRNRRVLRLNVVLFSRDRTLRTHGANVLDRLGFVQAEANTYTRTVALDLRPTEDELLSSFSSSVRKRLREFARLKVPLSIQHITDPSLAPRMNDLMQQTMARTGGQFVPVDWERRIALGTSQPSLYRIAGIVHRELEGDERLLAFVSGCHHGNRVQYSDGASARQLGRMPLMYPLLWDLIRWARGTGALWFDMGGVTAGSFGDGQDPLGGISDFKRRFSDDIIDVAEEWVLESETLVASLAMGLNRFRHMIRRFYRLATRSSPATSAVTRQPAT